MATAALASCAQQPDPTAAADAAARPLSGPPSGPPSGPLSGPLSGPPSGPPSAALLERLPDTSRVGLSFGGGSRPGCRPGDTLRTDALRATVRADVAKVRRFRTTDGTLTDVFISPDGSHATAILHPGAARGPQRFDVVVVEPGGDVRMRSVPFFQYGDGRATHGAAEHPSDCPPPPPPRGWVCSTGEENEAATAREKLLLSVDGSVAFLTDPPANLRVGWAVTFNLGVGLIATLDWQVSAPAVRCTAGRARIDGRRPNRPDLPFRAVFGLTYDPRSDDEGSMQAGRQSCEVRFELRSGAVRHDVAGTLAIEIAPDGMVRLGPESSPSPSGAPPARTF